ncbi:MAG: PLP-dependent transferase [Myxococcales bacterium]|nr:PLP-dependent transferase [Myxococcales bacterium]
MSEYSANLGHIHPSIPGRTSAVRAGIGQDTAQGAIVPPIYLSSNFSFAKFGQPRTYDYTRSGNPTRAELEKALAELEGGQGASCTSSGMSAVTLALHTFVLHREHKHPRLGRVVAQHDCYGGTHRLLTSLAEQGLFELTLLDLSDPANVAKLSELNADLVWLETPSNPLLRVIDIAAVSKTSGRARVLVDNTFLSPALQNPITLGADLVLHSTTKSINGHSDVVGGALVAKSKEDAERVAWWCNCLGVGQAPFDGFLVLRGLRTLHARWSIHEANARTLAERLAHNPSISAIHYPGLATHPGHELARCQQRGYGAIISIELKGGRDAAKHLVEQLQLFALAESLGGVESLVAHPATMTHAAMDEEARIHAGITDGMLRLSVGIEAIEDLVADLESGLDSLRQAA